LALAVPVSAVLSNVENVILPIFVAHMKKYLRLQYELAINTVEITANSNANFS